jgi:tetratricopeptide (TPR) repeat protein
MLILCGVLFSLAACAEKIVRPATQPPREPVAVQQTAKPVEKKAPVPPPVEKPPGLTKPLEQDVPAVQTQNPRLTASLALTAQAQQSLLNQDADGAIRILERAIVVDPTNGQNYYYLSEAWLMKGNIDQALKFNELAEIHLAAQPRWDGMVATQKQRILERSDIHGN